MSLYLDTSVLMPLYVEEKTSAAMAVWLEATSEALLVSDLTRGEFAAAVSRLVRMRALEKHHGVEIVAAFEEWCDVRGTRVENLPSDIREAAHLVRQPTPRLLMPDAIHLVACSRLGAILVTLDDDLVQIGDREAVAVLVPS
jgi:hypothetical protein